MKLRNENYWIFIRLLVKKKENFLEVGILYNITSIINLGNLMYKYIFYLMFDFGCKNSFWVVVDWGKY